ncbi:NAD(P)/FAD-dependent oxidoreductase [Pendulispora albinea]|uniref:Uncharacterized protein n=1 Tax=Pendulispora albinea TaxID=2741071 RepID=A0ABZ2LMR4_9BACT
MSKPWNKECDVLIIGGGLAGGTLARQLRLEQPELSIIQLDRKVDFDWWVGEATVEVFDDYAIRILKLGPYLWKKHILKHGLRFWFDNEERSLPLEEMSEWGRARYTSVNTAFQLDRASFDRDILQMNRDMGVECHQGARVLSGQSDDLPHIVIDRDEGHMVDTTVGTIRCKWLVDAGGRSSPLAQQLHLLHEGDGPWLRQRPGPTGSYWGRFKNSKSIDDFGNDAWRRKVGYTLRNLSTNHFMYPEYWIWHIPLTEDITSIGVSFDHDKIPLKMKSAQDLVAFFHQHRALRDILAGSECLDFMGLKYLRRACKQVYSTDRWFLTGMSGSFVDPLFSTTSASISVSNRFIAEMIRADREGDTVTFARRVRHCNDFMLTLYQVLTAGIIFDRFGSFDACAGWISQRFHNYWNYEMVNQLDDFKRYFRRIDAHDEHCGCSIARSIENHYGSSLIGVTDRLTDEFIALLRKRDLYFARNKGYFFEGSARQSLIDNAYRFTNDDRQRRLEQQVETMKSYEGCYRYFLRRACDIEGISWDEGTFESFFARDTGSGQTLADGLRAMCNPKSPSSALPAHLPTRYVHWTPKGPIDAYAREHHRATNQFIGPDGADV